jgi:hypothetical protein
VGNPTEVTSDENSYAETGDSRTIPDVPINKGHLTKITAERARRERPEFVAPAATNEVQNALVGKCLAVISIGSIELNQICLNLRLEVHYKIVTIIS